MELHSWAIIGGVVLIGVGGWLSTWGWNERGFYDQRRNIIIAVEREWQSNDSILNEAIHVIEEAPRSLDFPYRRYKVSALNSALTSGVLGFRNEGEKALRHAMSSYEKVIADFNVRLDIVGRHNPGMYIKTEFISEPEKIKSQRLENVLSETFQNLRLEHNKMGEFLQKEYNWAVSE